MSAPYPTLPPIPPHYSPHPTILDIQGYYEESAMVMDMLADYERPLPYNSDILAGIVFDKIPINDSGVCVCV